jgi:hypothetical protein
VKPRLVVPILYYHSGQAFVEVAIGTDNMVEKTYLYKKCII